MEFPKLDLNAIGKGLHLVANNDDRTLLVAALIVAVCALFGAISVLIWKLLNQSQANMSMYRDLTEAIFLLTKSIETRASKEDIQLLEHKIFTVIAGGKYDEPQGK